MEQRIFKRKIYDKILKWKEESQGKTALLIEGARRVGKSTIVEEFARKGMTIRDIPVILNKKSSLFLALGSPRIAMNMGINGN